MGIILTEFKHSTKPKLIYIFFNRAFQSWFGKLYTPSPNIL